MRTDKTKAVNLDSEILLRAIAPFVTSFGFKAHDTEPARMCTCSCFFVVLNSHWLMCTAAHVADDIRQLQEKGVKLTDWHVNDVFTGSTHDCVYPFDINVREQFYLRNDRLGIDYFLVYVDSLAATNMHHSGVRAFGRSLIGQPEEADRWVLTGFPSTFTKMVGSSKITQRHCLIGVTPIERPSSWLPESNQDSLFGRLDAPEGEPFFDIGGMSGGPIFGIYPKGDGTVNIKLVAVQSGWNPSTRIITACPVADFLDALAEIIHGDAPATKG